MMSVVRGEPWPGVERSRLETAVLDEVGRTG